jgi:electron transport complex protein RnfD
MQADEYRFYVSFPPHVMGRKSVAGMMHDNLIALTPAAILAVYYFRTGALKVMVLAALAAVLSEAGMQKFLKRDILIRDGQAVLTGLLLAFLLPPTVPWWMVVVGAVSAIVVGKMIFGEYGNNPFNPTLVGWVVLMLSWPEHIADWVEPFGGMIPDPPLQVFKLDGMEAFLDYDYHLLDLFLGKQAGGVGAVCGAALLAGGLYLMLRRVLTWHIPVSFLGTVFLFSGILWLVDRQANLNPLFHLLGGSTALGAFFLATDPVTSPVTRWGKCAYGMVCGILIVVIRTWGKYPDGVAFAILLANTSAPLLNKIRPRVYGKEKPVA